MVIWTLLLNRPEIPTTVLVTLLGCLGYIRGIQPLVVVGVADTVAGDLPRLHHHHRTHQQHPQHHQLEISWLAPNPPHNVPIQHGSVYCTSPAPHKDGLWWYVSSLCIHQNHTDCHNRSALGILILTIPFTLSLFPYFSRIKSLMQPNINFTKVCVFSALLNGGW